MPLTILQEDGPLGKAGTLVWINDGAEAEKPKAAPRKAPAKKPAK